MTHHPLDHEHFRVHFLVSRPHESAIHSFTQSVDTFLLRKNTPNQTGPGGAGAVEPVPIAATWQPTSLCRPKRPFQKCRSRGRLDVYK
ncbi:hypothetical protein ANTQUA_LOCUS989 [Anthophora quadrimaculata]